MRKHETGNILNISPMRLVIYIFLIIAFAAAYALGYLDPAISYLNSEKLSFSIGSIKFTAYTLIKDVVAIAFIFWLTSVASDYIESRLKKVSSINVSNKALLGKVMQVALYFVAFLFSLDLLGLDLTTLTVLGGAIGIGIGFGLQKITSNFISGLILLMEKSVEEGDLIQIEGEVYGFVRETNARYTVIETFEGKEVMIPNEDFITNKVTNWTYSNSSGRVDMAIGVSYDSDIKLARQLMLEAATEHERCSKTTPPECFLREFGDSSVNFLLIMWVEDVRMGRYVVQSEVLFSVWDKFKENNIAIPFPQIDLHIKDKGDAE